MNTDKLKTALAKDAEKRAGTVLYSSDPYYNGYLEGAASRDDLIVELVETLLKHETIVYEKDGMVTQTELKIQLSAHRTLDKIYKSLGATNE